MADIQVLAKILKYTVDEVKELTIEEIMQCIDIHSIEVGLEPVASGLTNLGKIESIQTEDFIPEGAAVELEETLSRILNEVKYLRQEVDLKKLSRQKMPQRGNTNEHRMEI